MRTGKSGTENLKRRKSFADAKCNKTMYIQQKNKKGEAARLRFFIIQSCREVGEAVIV